MCMTISAGGKVVTGLLRQSVWISLMFLFAIGSNSCATGANNLPPVSWQGDHIRFSTSVGRLPCGDSLVFMDGHVGMPATVEAGSKRVLALETGRYRVLIGRMASDFNQDPGLVQVMIQASTELSD